MSLVKKEEWPEIGELVIATVDNVTNYGVYVKLEEYNKEGFLHISEISSRWVKNIRIFVREGQKVVLKVLRVSPERNHIDLSLRRVSNSERREKNFLWKREKKIESLLRSVSERLGISLEDVHEKVKAPMEKNFGDIYEGLEKVAKEGVEILLEQDIPKDLAIVLAEIAKERIKVPMVKVTGTLNLSSTKPDGVLHIKRALLNAQNVDMPKGAEVNLYAVAAPEYRIEVLASDYKEANNILKKAVEDAINSIVKAGGQGSFKGS